MEIYITTAQLRYSSSKHKNAAINKAAIRRLDGLAHGEAYFEQIEEIISGVTTGLTEIRRLTA